MNAVNLNKLADYIESCAHTFGYGAEYCFIGQIEAMHGVDLRAHADSWSEKQMADFVGLSSDRDPEGYGSEADRLFYRARDRDVNSGVWHSDLELTRQEAVAILRLMASADRFPTTAELDAITAEYGTGGTMYDPVRYPLRAVSQEPL